MANDRNLDRHKWKPHIRMIYYRKCHNSNKLKLNRTKKNPLVN